MCLAVPGKIVEITEKNGLLMGKLDYAGTLQEACLEYVPEIKIGQYTVVHAGFALSVIDEEEANASFDAWQELIDVNKAQGTDVFGTPLKDEPDK